MWHGPTTSAPGASPRRSWRPWCSNWPRNTGCRCPTRWRNTCRAWCGVRGAGNDGRALTLRSLLTHTSGLYDFAADTRGTVPLTPLQSIRLALTHPPAAPGRYSYSNTNYVLLGLVVEQVTGRSYATEAERRI